MTPALPRSRRRLWIATLLGSIALFCLWALAREPAAEGLRQALHRGAAPARQFGSEGTVKALVRTGALELAAPRDESWELPEVPRRGVPKAHRSAPCPEILYRPRRQGGAAAAAGLPVREAWPATALPKPANVPKGLPVVSVAVETCRLRRLLENPRGSGRAWEEPAFLSYFEDGRPRLESGIGLRLHGGRKRFLRVKSFRLHFRPELGLPALPSGILRKQGTSPEAIPPADVVVLYRAMTRDGQKRPWQWIDALAYDIAARLGGLVPAARPVALLLNGDLQGAYLLSERIDEAYLERHFGSSRFDRIKPKDPVEGRSGRLDNELRRWALEEEPLTSEKAAQRVDLDNLTRWTVAVIYSATGDTFQAIQLKRRRQDDARWFWIHWDPEMSFRTLLARPEHGWDKNLLRFISTRSGGGRSFPRTLLNRLINEDEDFRGRLTDAVTEALNHRLTPDFLAGLLAEHEALADALGVEDRRYLDEIREFFRRRPDILRRQVQEQLGAGPTHTLRLDLPAGLEVEVDGYPVRGTWSGTYFEGQTPALETPEAQGRPTWSWFEDGMVVGDGDLGLEMTRDRRLELRRRSLGP